MTSHYSLLPIMFALLLDGHGDEPLQVLDAGAQMKPPIAQTDGPVWSAHNGRSLYTSSGWLAFHPYTADLLALNLCRPQPVPTHLLLRDVNTPLRVSAWTAALIAHPDRAFVRYLVARMTDRFLQGPVLPLKVGEGA